MSVNFENINRSRSMHTDNSFANTVSRKSDGSLSSKNDFTIMSREDCFEGFDTPEKDDISLNDSFIEHNDSTTAANKDSITNSDLDKLELEIMQTMSENLQINETSVTDIDSVIKILKTNVQNIFYTFDQNMQDFEVFKYKYNEIMQKYRHDPVKEIGILLQDILEHVHSSEDNDSSLQLSNVSSRLKVADSNFDSFNNLNFTTVSTQDEESCKLKTNSFNTFVLSNPYIEKELNDRNLLSEINIREKIADAITTLASTENLKKLAAKKLEIDNYSEEQKDPPHKDRDIPIKNSYAKKDIYLDEDFESAKSEEEKFFIFKICSYICKKIRRNPFA